MIVSLAVVAYNEEQMLPRLLEDICRQDYPHEKIEILLIDSISTDRTREIMEEFSARDHGFLRVLILQNPGKILPCGCNVMLKNYTGDAVVRIDAHASIPADFLSKNVAVLESGEDICGGQVESILERDTPLQRTLLLAENSAFCGGVASFRRLKERTYVSTLAFAMYRRRVFEQTGFYNENLSRTEDNEMHYRMRKQGFLFCMVSDIHTTRYTRSSFRKLLRQKYLNGYWIGKTLGICPGCFSLYHFVPFVFVIGILFTTLLAMVGFLSPSVLMWSAYCLLALAASVLEGIRQPFSAVTLLTPLIFFFLHVSYGFGTMVGLAELPFWLRNLKKVGEKADGQGQCYRSGL